MNKNQLPKLAFNTFFVLMFIVISIVSPAAFAANNKIDLDAGFFSVTASGTKSGSISGVGAYRIGYRRSIHPHFDIGVGYTIMFTQLVTGDSAFGLDINGTYFFLGSSGFVESTTDQSYLGYSEDIRPFVSVNFAQRNFQSFQTSYAGFGGVLGFEKSLAEKLSLKLSARYNSLSAGSKTTASTITELSVLGGIVIEF